MKSFEKFTNLYSLSKTLRFELKPVGKTQQTLENENVFEKDLLIQRKYEQTKPFFDELHRDFVKEALSDVKLNKVKDYWTTWKAWEKDKKENDKKLKDIEKRLRKDIVASFNRQAKIWVTEKYLDLGITKSDHTFLFEKQGDGIFSLLKSKYGNDKDAFVKDEKGEFVLDENSKKISIFDSWKGFTGYFTKFFETRKNFYKDDGTSTAIATRIIDQNLKRFCDNLEVFKKAQEKNIDFSDIENSFGKKMEEIFLLDFYNNCLLQEGIDFYNKILGGDVLANGEKRKGINELINKFRQDNKGEKLSFLKLLDKQILSKAEKRNLIDEIESDEQLLGVLKLFKNTADEKIKIFCNLFSDFIKENQKYDLTRVYISKEALNTIVNKWIGTKDLFQKELYDVMKEGKILNGLRCDKQDNAYKFSDFVALSFIRDALGQLKEESVWKDHYQEDITNFSKMNTWQQFLAIWESELSSLFEKEIINKETGEKVKVGYDFWTPQFNLILKDFKNDKKSKIAIKNYADSVLTIYKMAKYFAVEKKRKWLDDYELDDFYTKPDSGYLLYYDSAYEEIVQVYNKLRNYLTKKGYNEEKWKLNLECSYLLNGWSSEMRNHSSLLFKKEDQYYLGIVNGVLNDEQREELKKDISKDNRCKKMVYDFQKPDNKNVPRLFIRSKGTSFAPAVEELNLPVDDILDLYDKRLFKTSNKNYQLFRRSLVKLIDYFKLGFQRHLSYKGFKFNWKMSSAYHDISEFYEDVIRSCYMLDWEDVSFDKLLELTNEGRFYLFHIYNKDFSIKSSGESNLHTLYFKKLFDKDNLENKKGVILKLSGGGEVFFRPKTATDKLGYKQDNNKKSVVDHKRYNKDKIFLHFPIELNYSRSQRTRFNNVINDFLAKNSDINIIGVDRGEKHLAYYSVINQQGEVIDANTLNVINNVDYHEKLSQRAEERELAKKDWQFVEGIKNLKKGYISQVVKKLADLAIKYNAIIVFEDLNMRFKQIRGGIEKSIYQQLEKALIDKLNYLVNKGEKDPKEAGHLLKAYQLTAPFTTFKDMGKQTGILFYTQAGYTSKIDPLTGWRPNLYLKYVNAKQAKKEILKFKEINYNSKNNYFEFTYNIYDFIKEMKEYPEKLEWTVCSCVERYWWDRTQNNNKGDYNHYASLTKDIKQLFEKYEVKISNDIIEQIKKIDEKGNEEFFRSLIFYFRLICQIRNTKRDEEGDKNDFIVSPVKPFFDSRKAEQYGEGLPKNGDENGAYNIARKGIIILNKITDYHKKNGSCENLGWGDLYVSNLDWDNFAQK